MFRFPVQAAYFCSVASFSIQSFPMFMVEPLPTFQRRKLYKNFGRSWWVFGWFGRVERIVYFFFYHGLLPTGIALCWQQRTGALQYHLTWKARWLPCLPRAICFLDKQVNGCRPPKLQKLKGLSPRWITDRIRLQIEFQSSAFQYLRFPLSPNLFLNWFSSWWSSTEVL